jgi:hypothetical protein
MNAKQLERASYLAAHAVLASDTSAPQFACPGTRRSYAIDIIADTIKSVFQLHCSALEDSTEWWAVPAPRSMRSLSDAGSEAEARTGELQAMI